MSWIAVLAWKRSQKRQNVTFQRGKKFHVICYFRTVRHENLRRSEIYQKEVDSGRRVDLRPEALVEKKYRTTNVKPIRRVRIRSLPGMERFNIAIWNRKNSAEYKALVSLEKGVMIIEAEDLFVID